MLQLKFFIFGIYFQYLIENFVVVTDYKSDFVQESKKKSTDGDYAKEVKEYGEDKIGEYETYEPTPEERKGSASFELSLTEGDIEHHSKEKF